MKNSSALQHPESAVALHDGPAGVPELELPDAPGFVSRRSPVSLERALVLLEERRQWFPLSPAARQARSCRKVVVEFVL